jgi:hypothetical protein
MGVIYMLLIHHNDMRFECVFGYQVWEKPLKISVKHSCQQNHGGFCQNNKYLKYEVYVICMVFRTTNFSLENFFHLTIN